MQGLGCVDLVSETLAAFFFFAVFFSVLVLIVLCAVVADWILNLGAKRGEFARGIIPIGLFLAAG